MAEEKSKLATAIEHLQYASSRLGELTVSYRAAKNALLALQSGNPATLPPDLQLQIVVGGTTIALNVGDVPAENMLVMLSSTCDCLAAEVRATFVAAHAAAADGIALVDAASDAAVLASPPIQPAPASVVG